MTGPSPPSRGSESLAVAHPNRPTFICIGAGKAGTTWLWEMLRQHPDLFLPDVKEIDWFNEISFEGSDVRNPNHAKSVEWYLSHFDDARPGQVSGEISPSYLWDATAARSIHDFDPDMKVLVMLRDPVERLFSSYLYGKQKGAIGRHLTFEEALVRVDYLLGRAAYCPGLHRYLDLFDRAQVKAVFHDDLVVDPVALLEEIEAFIGVPPFVPDNVRERHNVTMASKYPAVTETLMRLRIAAKRYGLEWMVERGRGTALHHLFRWFQAQVRPYDEKPSVSAATDENLRQRFIEDIECVERLLAVDLSRWKKPRASRR